MDKPDYSYYLTLHVDLLATDLDDFKHHILWQLQGLAPLALVDDQGGQWKEGIAAEPREPNMITAQWNLHYSVADIAMSISLLQRGNTTCSWHGIYLKQGIWPYSKPAGGKMDFTLEATHYRRDRLNVVMWESPREPVIGDDLLEWMKQYWRDGVKNRLDEGDPEPEPQEDVSSQRWQPRSAADRWLIAEYFDTYKEQRGLGNFEEEWKARRHAENIPERGDPGNIMASVITRERRQRGGES